MRCGGCAAKIGPGPLSRALGRLGSPADSDVTIGLDAPDDAAVLAPPPAGHHIVATVDLFRGFIGDPYLFGEIAANHALNDIFAMGGTPRHALAIAMVPHGPPEKTEETLFQLLAGARACLDREKVALVGGHSAEGAEIAFGFSVSGTVAPGRIRRKAGLRTGDALILTKPIGIGIYSNALRHGALDAAGYSEMLAVTTLLNRIGSALGDEAAVHAMTDVTGFGLLGHGLEMARGARATLRIDAGAVPLLRQTEALLRAGHLTGASQRNWDSYGPEVVLSEPTAATDRVLLTDPQTSGGLLLACAADAAERLLACIRAAGHAQAAIIGKVEQGVPRVVVTHS
jgi:selenide,water dikinase